MGTKSVFLAVILSCFVWVPLAFASVFPLEITNIKAAGTGSPAIPSTNRIFRAYPGIEYNIRAAVIGGLYPYTYSLSNAPSGMTINSKTGEISWPNPQANSGTITLSVTDSESTTVTSTWAITVSSSTSNFIFVQSGYAGTETGSITQPYSSIANMLSNESSGSKIVYFRSGSYQMPFYNDSYAHGMNLTDSPKTWLEYPGESVTLQGGSGSGQADRIAVFDTLYFDGLTIKDVVDYGIITQGGVHYKTIRRCVFDGLVPSDNVNNNYGFIHTTNSGGDGYFSVIQDNDFSDWRGSSAIGSLYYDVKMLIENNYIHDQRATSTYDGVGGTYGISPKYGSDYLTVRGNRVSINSSDEYDSVMGGNNAAFSGGSLIEICFNLFVKSSGRGGHIFDWQPGDQGSTYYWRNTLIGDLTIRSGLGGPFYINNNVISNPNTTFEGYLMTSYISHSSSAPTLSNYATVANNLTNTTASTLVDSADSYKLQPAQSAYIGTQGWQLADGSTPLETSGGTPDPTCSDGVQNGDETGVDCGGSCSACSAVSMPIGAGTMPIGAGSIPISVQ